MQNEEKGAFYRDRAKLRQEAMREYLWDPVESQWFDYDFKENQRKIIVSASNFYPLWAGCAYPDQVELFLSLFPF